MSGHFGWSGGLFLGDPRGWRDPIPKINTSEILLYIQIRLSKTQDNDNTKCWKDVEKRELPLLSWEHTKEGQEWKAVWQFLTN